MIDHVSLPITDIARSIAFYERALAPLGYRLMVQGEGYAGFVTEAPDFWLTERGASPPSHVAFRAKDADQVRAFHAAALEAGATDNGAPGYREYHPGYFGAFVLDPDGHNVEAVWHDASRMGG